MAIERDERIHECWQDAATAWRTHIDARKSCIHGRRRNVAHENNKKIFHSPLASAHCISTVHALSSEVMFEAEMNSCEQKLRQEDVWYVMFTQAWAHFIQRLHLIDFCRPVSLHEVESGVKSAILNQVTLIWLSVWIVLWEAHRLLRSLQIASGKQLIACPRVMILSLPPDAYPAKWLCVYSSWWLLHFNTSRTERVTIVAERPYVCGSVWFCAACVNDYSANNTRFWGKFFKLFTSSNWLAEEGLYWVSSYCYGLWRITELHRNEPHVLWSHMLQQVLFGRVSNHFGWHVASISHLFYILSELSWKSSHNYDLDDDK